jgi:DNA modification methylase
VTPFVQDADFQLYVGDALEVLRELPDESVHCVVTSPPYWGLRDYGTEAWDGGDAECAHRTGRVRPEASTLTGGKDNLMESEGVYRDVCGKCGATRVDQQLGLEPTPEQFVANMVDVFREVRRVLRADGTCFVNLGDSYAATVTSDRHFTQPTGPDGTPATKHPPQFGGQRTAVSGLKPKDLCGMPWRVAFALQADGWYLRSDIIWSKPNPMPESVTDRPTKAHEYVFLLTRSPRYFFDNDAIREPHNDKAGDVSRFGNVGKNGGQQGQEQPDAFTRVDFPRRPGGREYHPAGRNIRSVWELATQPYPEAHFATFPEALPERCIRAGTSERGCCPECGAPWERVVVATGADNGRVREDVGDWIKHKGGNADGKRSRSGATYKPQRAATDDWRSTCSCADASGADDTLTNTAPAPPSLGGVDDAGAAPNPVATKGWQQSCSCDGCGTEEPHMVCTDTLNPVPCTVLDPFMGSGTVALVARRLGRRSIGVELNESYAALCARRLQQLSLFAGATDG